MCNSIRILLLLCVGIISCNDGETTFESVNLPLIAFDERVISKVIPSQNSFLGITKQNDSIYYTKITTDGNLIHQYSLNNIFSETIPESVFTQIDNVYFTLSTDGSTSFAFSYTTPTTEIPTEEFYHCHFGKVNASGVLLYQTEKKLKVTQGGSETRTPPKSWELLGIISNSGFTYLPYMEISGVINNYAYTLNMGTYTSTGDLKDTFAFPRTKGVRYSSFVLTSDKIMVQYRDGAISTSVLYSSEEMKSSTIELNSSLKPFEIGYIQNIIEVPEGYMMTLGNIDINTGTVQSQVAYYDMEFTNKWFNQDIYQNEAFLAGAVAVEGNEAIIFGASVITEGLTFSMLHPEDFRKSNFSVLRINLNAEEGSAPIPDVLSLPSNSNIVPLQYIKKADGNYAVLGLHYIFDTFINTILINTDSYGSIVNN